MIKKNRKELHIFVSVLFCALLAVPTVAADGPPDPTCFIDTTHGGIPIIAGVGVLYLRDGTDGATAGLMVVTGEINDLIGIDILRDLVVSVGVRLDGCIIAFVECYVFMHEECAPDP